MTVKGAIVDPVDIGTVATPPFVRLPDLPTVFARRADRLAALAVDNALADYLSFMAALTGAQAAALGNMPVGTMPGADDIAAARAVRRPPLGRAVHPLDPSWQVALYDILARLDGVTMPAAADAARTELADVEREVLSALARRVLRNDTGAQDAARACFVTAALQVSWTRMAASLDPADIAPIEPPTACPVCGSPPVASVVHIGGALQGTRYLCCSLCSAQWHYVRIKCANCQSTEGITYQQIAEQSSVVKAEACDGCRTYTKIIYLEKDPHAEVFADDLATVALDLLVGEAGWTRASPNPFLVSTND